MQEQWTDPETRQTSMMQTQAARSTGPGSWLYVLGALLLAVAVALPIVAIAQFVSDILNMGLASGMAPGEIAFTVDKPGTYLVFREYTRAGPGYDWRRNERTGSASDRRDRTSHSDSQAGQADEPTDLLEANVRNVATGEIIDVAPCRSHVTYSSGRSQSVGLWEFTAPAAGQYVLSASYPADATGPNIRLVVSRPMPTAGMFGIFGSFGIAALLLGGGIAIILVTAVKRSAARRKPVATSGIATPPAPSPDGPPHT